MCRFSLILLATLSLMAPGRVAIGDDLGKFLKQATRDVLTDPRSPNQPPNAQARRSQAEPFTIKTADGWTLVAHRYRPPAGQPRAGSMPVILCHGLTYNAAFWDLDPSCSLAEYLSQLGFDVWAVNLRGCGMSQKWVWKIDETPDVIVGGTLRKLTRGKIAPTGYATLNPRFANWTMDDHIAHDVPALVALVRRHTGVPAVAWVGHSMGGIVALCHLARFPNPGIGKLLTVGSQVTMPEGRLAAQFLEELLQTRQRQLLGRLQGKEVMTQTKTSVHNMFFNTRNVSPQVYEALSGWATDVPSAGLLEQYTELALHGELLDAKKQYNYARNLGNIKVPVFLSCGASDRFAPPVVQRYLFEHVGSADKTLVILGRSQGLSIDAGHDDSLVGLNSRDEVYPILARWLAGVKP